MKTFKSELATEILQKPHNCSVSLKQPQLSASLRSGPKNTRRSHNTFCLCVLLIGFRLPAGVQPVSLATSNACKPQWYLFPSLLLKGRLSEVSQEGLSINTPLADTLRGRNFLPKSWQQPPQAAPLKSALSYFAEFISSVIDHSHVHKVWETSDAVYGNTWLTTGWRKEDENLSKTSKQDGTGVLPSLAVTGRKVQYFSRVFLGVSFIELLLRLGYSFTNILPLHTNASTQCLALGSLYLCTEPAARVCLSTTQIPSLLQTFGGKAQSGFGPPGTCSALREPLLFLSLWWAALHCPSKGQFFGALQTHFPLCSSNSPGQGRLSLTCFTAVSPRRPFWIWEKKGSFMLPCLQGHLHSSFTGAQPVFPVT